MMEGATADGDADEPLPPWLPSAAASSPASVPTLQDMVCTVLARHLHCFESLDDLPEHLAASVKAAVQRDRRLLAGLSSRDRPDKCIMAVPARLGLRDVDRGTVCQPG